MKKIAKILFWSVLFVWMIFLQPQNVMAAEADEIIKELDFTDINAQTQDLPEKMDFEKMVNKLVTEGTGGLDAGMICEYIADLFLRLDLLFRNLRYRRNGLFCTDYVRVNYKCGVSQGSKTLEKQLLW